jgi:uncharacterized protein (TIGR03437 family)
MRRFGSSAEVLVFMLAAASPNAAWGQASKPTVTTVANVASYANSSISPGEMVVIFGAGMGPAQVVTAQLDQQGRVASTLLQVQVLFDGTAAPLIYVSAKQISAMVPYVLAGKSTTQVQVVYQGVASDPFQKTVAPAAPGIFTADSSGQGQAAITNADGSYNTATNPATPGSFFTFYLTGEGPTDPPGSDGNVATSTANVALPVTVLIAGRTAQLLYAGSAPGNVNGFAQINVVIPADMQYGGNPPLVVQIGGVPTQTGVTLAVSGPPAPIPANPQSLTASVNASGQVVLAWMPADSLATRFHIERQMAGSGFTEIAMLQATATTFTDPNVSAETTYQYRVRAESDYGFSPYSAVVNATIPAAQLPPPSNVQAVAVSQSQINLTWSAVTNATRFHVERKTGAAGTYAEITAVPATTTSYQDTTVQSNTAYTYRVRSEGASGFSAYSNETSATTPALPLPPAPTLQGTATSATTLHLSWTTTVTGIIRFRLERRLTTGVYSEIAQPSATSTSFDDSGVTGSTSYLYRMRVETGAGLSAYSNEVAVTTFPTAPTSLQATATSSSQVNLTWTNNAQDATAIRVEFLPPGSTAFTDIGVAVTLTNTPAANLQANTMYTFRVRAQNGVGYSAYSNVATAKTLQALPATPTNLQATASSSSQVNLTWTNNAPDATAIRVEYLPPSATTFTDIGAATTLTNSPVTSLQSNTTYSFRVRAQNAVGYSPYSNLATVTTQTPPVTVVLIHGILQSGGALEPLAKTLRPLLTPGRFTVLSDFNWGRCANPTGLVCDSNCTLEEGATELLNYLNTNVPPGDVLFVGYSMGGLIVRQLLLTTQFTRNRPLALITLGTPNLGYPYSPLDALAVCSSLGAEMKGDFRANNGQGIISSFLGTLNNTWAASSPAPARGQWLAISGASCNNPISFTLSGGCPDSNVFSDGVVCDVSARLLFQYKNRPSQDHFSYNFSHDGGVGLFCLNLSGIPALYNAGASSDVGLWLVNFINGQ